MNIKNGFFALICCVFAATSLASSGLTGRPAPDFALKSSSGENLRLSEYRGDVVMVNFWATWCGPCQYVAPILEDLAGQYAGKIKVAKLDVDSNPQTTQRFNVRSIPSILFFKDGKHVDTVIGAVPKDMLKGKIDALIA